MGPGCQGPAAKIGYGPAYTKRNDLALFGVAGYNITLMPCFRVWTTLVLPSSVGSPSPRLVVLVIFLAVPQTPILFFFFLTLAVDLGSSAGRLEWFRRAHGGRVRLCGPPRPPSAISTPLETQQGATGSAVSPIGLLSLSFDHGRAGGGISRRVKRRANFGQNCETTCWRKFIM